VNTTTLSYSDVKTKPVWIIRSAKTCVRVCLTTVGVLLILLALISASVRLGLPLVTHFKPSIESRLSEYLSGPVAIGDLKLSWVGFGPMLKAEKVAVSESSDRKVTIDELLIDVNLAKSFAAGVPVINELTLVGASLSLEADEAGRYRLHGMQKVREADKSSANRKGLDLMAWLLTAKKVGLLDTQVTLIDEQADLRLVMQDLNIRAENQGDSHQLRFDVRLPEELGGSLTAGLDVVGEVDAWDQAIGDFYVRADSLQVNALTEVLKVGGLADQLQRLGSPLDTAVSFELWGRWEDGQLKSARGPITTTAIINSTTGEVIGDGINASLELSVTDESVSLKANDAIVSMGADTIKIEQIQGNWNHARVGDQPSRQWGILASGADIDIAPSARFLEGVLEEFNSQISKSLELAKPSGQILNWSLGYGSDGFEPMLSLEADLYKIQNQSAGELPSIGPVYGRVDITDSLGDIALTAVAMPVEWPNVMSAELNSLKAVLGVDLTDIKNIMIDGDIELEDDGMDVSTRLNATIASGQSPHLDMQSRFTAKDITAVKQWLPQNIQFTRWANEAVNSGSVSDGSMLVFGHLSDFPYDSGEGVFRVNARVNDGHLRFLKEWPEVFNINGDFKLNGLTLSGIAQDASIDKFDIPQVRLHIEDLKKTELQITGTGTGNLQEVVDFGVKGPLKAVLEPAINDVVGSGQVNMDLYLNIPLYRKKLADSDSLKPNARAESLNVTNPRPPITVNGSLFLNGNAVEFQRANIPLQNVQGAIGFNTKGIRVNKIKAKFLSQSIQVSANTKGVSDAATTTISVAGAVEGNDVLVHYENALDQFLRGASKWNVEVAVPHSEERLTKDGVQMQIQSDLVGTELLLPRPLYKTSGEAREFLLSTAFKTDGSEQRWDIKLDGKLHAGVITNPEGLQSLVANLGTGKLWNTAMINPAPGLRLQGNIGRLAADEWVDTISQYLDALEALEDDDSAAPEPIIPISTQFSIDSMELGTESLGKATLSMASNNSYVTTTIKNASLEGQITYPRNHWSKKLPMKAQFEHVDMAVIDALNTRDADAANDRVNVPLDPTTLPPIEAKVERFTVAEQTVKNIVLRAQPDISGLRVTTLGFAYAHMQLVGQGYWRLKDPQGVNPLFKDQHQTQFDLVLQSDDFGKGFEHIDLHDVMSQGQGTVELQLSWAGPAYLPSVADLDGRIKLTIERGSIIPVEPGAGRLVGLFALQALPRRLNLDFSDISNDGLAFTEIKGNALIDKGVLDVSLLQLRGPIGVVDLAGKSDLNTREFDQTVTVLPRVSAALPIIGIISGGATAGVGALLATGLLKALGIDLDRIGLREYDLTGTWDEPIFQQIKASAPTRRER